MLCVVLDIKVAFLRSTCFSSWNVYFDVLYEMLSLSDKDTSTSDRSTNRPLGLMYTKGFIIAI